MKKIKRIKWENLTAISVFVFTIERLLIIIKY